MTTTGTTINTSRASRNKPRFICSLTAAGIIGILFAGLFFYIAYRMGYVTIYDPISFKYAAILAFVLCAVASVVALSFYMLCQLLATGSASTADDQAAVPLINQPALQKPLIRGLEIVVSVTAWVFFLYMLQSFFAAIIWIFGGRLMYFHVFRPEAIHGTINMLLVSSLLAVIMLLLMFLWASWNYWRFGRLERRKPRPPIPDDIVAGFYGVPVTLVEQARQVKVAKVIPLPVGLQLATDTAGVSEKLAGPDNT